MKKKEVPKSLRIWFKIHFLADMIFAIPLFIAPVWFLNILGFTIVEPVTARLVAAALLGIGGTSYFTKEKYSFDILLTLKLIWSSTAVIGLIWSIIDGAPLITWLIVIIFAAFFGVWLYYKRTISS